MVKVTSFITGTEKFDYWCRKTEEGLYIFFANPRSQHLTFPLEYGQSLNDKAESYHITINYHGAAVPADLQFNPYQSLLLKLDNQNKISFIDITFNPKIPVYKPRIKNGKERWEVDPGSK